MKQVTQKNKLKSDNRNPLVSVIMPVFNAESYLVESIESIIRQTYSNFELIIVDDASTDSSRKIIRKYHRFNKDKIRPVYLTQNQNNGGDACANYGFALSRGKYIARMDADDVSHLERLEKQVAFMEKHKDVIVCGTQGYVIDKFGRINGQKLEPTSNEVIRKNYFIFHPMIHPTVMIRKNMLPKRGFLYRIKYCANNDLLTFFELLNYGKFANLEEKLIYYRIHGQNDSLVEPKKKFLNTIKIRMYAVRHFGYRPTVMAVLNNIMQLAVIALLPSSLISTLYLLWRGLIKPRDLISFPRISTAVSRV